MRSGLSTIQQTLTLEASTVLSHSISETGRRNHSQVTPLHVAATLLASPSSFLRQACIRSHPNSSHPLQCRALELCFSVALDRLPMTQSDSDSADPPISNALMAALKRAQAHQRRGCPEQQQQPLLAVKVELEQLIISILDDPSVSRVMREASFSSPAVKATIEKSMSSASSCNLSSSNSHGFRPSPVPVPKRNVYDNPRLQQNNVTLGLQFGLQHKVDDVKRLVEIMSRNDKRNPVLVGDSELDSVLTQLFAKIENNELSDTVLTKVQFVHMDKVKVLDRSLLLERMKELEEFVADKCGDGYGVILNLGDLKWLVEEPGNGGGIPGWVAAAQQVGCEVGRLVVEEVRKLLRRFGSKLWLVGTASCQTYLRCKVYHNSLESDWDLQTVPIAAKTPAYSAFPRLGTTGFLGNSIQPVTPMKSFSITSMNSFARPSSENLDPASKMTCCLQCKESYEKELANVSAGELETSSAEPGKPLLPTWLQTSNGTDQQFLLMETEVEKRWKQKIEELTKKWNETCACLHGSFNHVLGSEGLTRLSTPSMISLLNPKLVAQQNFKPKLQPQRSFVETTLQLNPTLVPSQPLIGLEKVEPSPPRSLVRTELVLGRNVSPEKNPDEETKDFVSCISYDPQKASIEMQANKLLSSLLDADWLKKLMKILMDKVWWQREAASAVATAMAQCRLGNGKQRGAGWKGTVWLLFTGPDRIGKKKMASALSELVCSLGPVVISFGSRQSDDNINMNTSFRGKTALDRIGEAIRRNPFSVVVLEDIDEANMLIRGNIKRAMERGRITDSHGREVSLGNVTFILTSNWLPEEFKMSSNVNFNAENNLIALASENWHLKLTICEKTMKKRSNQTTEEELQDRRTKLRTGINSALSFDLNEALDIEDDRANGSGDSSDLTAEPEDYSGNGIKRYSFINPATRDLLKHVDSSIAFDPVDFSSIRQKIASSISNTFFTIIRSDGASIQVNEDALENILSGIWLGQTSLEDWLVDVLVPSLHQLKTQLQCHNSSKPCIIQLEIDDVSTHPGHRNFQDWLPSSIRVATCMQ